MASGSNQNGSKGEVPLTTLQGADVIGAVHQKAKRKIGAVQRKPFGKRLLNVIRNLMWVVPLTILVWLYAEREQLDQARVSVPISVVSDRSDHMVTLLASMPAAYREVLVLRFQEEMPLEEIADGWFQELGANWQDTQQAPREFPLPGAVTASPIR